MAKKQLPLSLDEYNALKRKVDERRRNRDMATGALESIKSKLEEEYGYDDLEQARKKLLPKLKKKEEETAQESGRTAEIYRSKWADKAEEKE